MSPFQIGKAKEFTEKQGLSSKMEYRVADAMKMPFADNSYDLSKWIHKILLSLRYCIFAFHLVYYVMFKYHIFEDVCQVFYNIRENSSNDCHP